MKCPKCEQKEQQYKNGKTKSGSQRYRCRHCGCSYTPEKKAQGYSPAFRRKALKMYVDGSGFRRTGRQLGIHHQTVANWAKEEAERLPEASMPAEVKTAEFDEIFTYIGDKKPNLSHYTCRSRNTLLFRAERTSLWCCECPVDAIFVNQVDRLSRDIVDLLATVRNWLRVGVEVYALDVGKIDSELDIVLVIKGWQGSDERKKIRERSMRGKRAKARSGQVIGSWAPYGYDHVRDENGKIVNFEPLEEETKIVQLIYEWYVNGDETGQRLSAGKIAKRLSVMRIPTPGETNAGYHRSRENGM